jgi:type II secretory pathway pseudopilin PulG
MTDQHTVAPKKKKLAAFTLIEILIYMTLMSIITGAITGIILQTYTFKTSVEDRARVNEDMRNLIKSIRDDMYFGDAVQVTAQGNLVISSSFNSPSQVTYSLSNGQVLRQEGVTTAVPVTSEDTEVRAFTLVDESTPSSAGVIRLTLVMSNYPRGPLKLEVVRDITSTISLKYI